MTRQDFHDWLMVNHQTAAETYIPISRAKTPAPGCVPYVDAVEEALCFGWIDSTNRSIDGVHYSRFSPRRKGSNWTELNKARCKRLIRLGLMTDAGFKTLPDLDAPLVVQSWITDEFKKHTEAYANFLNFPELYQRIRLSNIDFSDKHLRNHEEAVKKLQRLIETSEHNKMYGDWNDNGRLLEE